MNRRRRIYEGKAKILYEGPEPGTLIQHFKDDATAFNNKKHDKIEGKGVLNNRISEYLFVKLGEIGVPTHFIKRLNMREQLIARWRSSRSRWLCAMLPPARSRRASASMRVPRCRAPSSNSTTSRTSSATRWSPRSTSPPSAGPSPQELDDIMSLALRINDFLSGLFLGVGIRLVDFKCEFGRLWENDQMRIVLADEISPDCCRLWDVETQNKLDKDRFRRDMGGLVEAYQEVARRLGLHVDNPMRVKSGPVLVRSK